MKATLLVGTLIGCFFGSLLACEVVRRIAIKRALLDKINERSLHTAPTPRLGGVGIVIASLAGAFVSSDDSASHRLQILLLVCSAMAVLGLTDDLRPLPAALRLAIQAGLSVAFLRFIGVPPLVLTGDITLPLGAIATGALLVVWLVAVLNIYNFMDGMDGLAGSQAISMSGVIAFILLTSGAASEQRGLAGFALAICGAALGFLAQNFPPARMFMGDAGSTFLGMAFGSFAILGMHDRIPILQSAAPLAPFLLDGTFTILRRASRRERIWQAHRTHLYQRAVQSGLQHRDVLLVYLAWMAACAGAAILTSPWMAWVVAVLGLILVWLWVRGRESKLAAST